MLKRIRARVIIGVLLIATTGVFITINVLKVFSHHSTSKPEATLNPLSIPKFVNQLVIPPTYAPKIVTDKKTGAVISHDYTVDMSEFQEQILPPGFPTTKVWGYGGLVKDPSTGKLGYFRSSPGPTFEAVRGIPINVKWENKLTGSSNYAVDPTLHWANPNMMSMSPAKPWPAFPQGFSEAQSPIPSVPHLHGGETASIYDGNPDAWFTSCGMTGPAYATSTYTYLNTQNPETLWYHDHAMGMTRTNVYSGLAGFYLLNDPKDPLENQKQPENSILPIGNYDVPLVIQDRSFNSDGSFFFNCVGEESNIHPYWVPEFFGNTIVVNGKVWPNFNVERREYRLRVLNGSNARFYNLSLSNKQTFTQVASDGGYLPSPVELTSLLLAPGERADILIDFSSTAPGSAIILNNDASAPYPSGDKPDANTVGQIMQFTVSSNSRSVIRTTVLPTKLADIPKLAPNAPTRVLTLNEASESKDCEGLFLNGQKWEAPISENTKVGSTEDWQIVNLTEDAHPIHLHLIDFQLVSRQAIDTEKYSKVWYSANGMLPLKKPTISIPIDKYIKGDPMPPNPNEAGWKDTIQANPGEVTTIRVRFAPQDASLEAAKPGINLFPFDPTSGPGYVWHCHILDHEDNEMMRPFKVMP